mgnify:CR=1 FL=1
MVMGEVARNKSLRHITRILNTEASLFGGNNECISCVVRQHQVIVKTNQTIWHTPLEPSILGVGMSIALQSKSNKQAMSSCSCSKDQTFRHTPMKKWMTHTHTNINATKLWVWQIEDQQKKDTHVTYRSWLRVWEGRKAERSIRWSFSGRKAETSVESDKVWKLSKVEAK